MLTESRIAVRYPDCDPMGIVHHAVYPIWYEIARMDFLAAAGFSYSDMHVKGINPPMVNLNLSYYAPVRYPGNVTVRTVCTLCQGKKLELKYSVYPDDASTPSATATSFHIWTGPDMKSLDMRSLPEVYEKLLDSVTKPAVLIFAGGRSSRMGTDKAKETLSGETLLERAVGFWKETLPGAKIYVAAGTPAHFEALPPDVTPVYDIYPQRGPMGGLHAAFKETSEELFLVSAVDMPLISKDAVALLDEKRHYSEDICVFTKGGKPEPLFGYYRRSCLESMEHLLAAGENKMGLLLKAMKTTSVPLREEAWVSNINTPEELKALRNSIT